MPRRKAPSQRKETTNAVASSSSTSRTTSDATDEDAEASREDFAFCAEAKRQPDSDTWDVVQLEKGLKDKVDTGARVEPL